MSKGAEYSRRWRERNPEKVREMNRRFREDPKNKERIREYHRKFSSSDTMKKWKEENKGKISEYQKNYYNRNREKRSVGGRGTQYKLANNMRRRLNLALRGGWKSGHTLELLGIPLWMFRWYIETQFKSGMTWENYGPVWHIDHIKPCASFNLKDSEQQKICFRWDNLQPLFAKENLQKGTK